MRRPLACSQLKKEIAGRSDLYLLLVADDCPYCKQVLDAISEGKVSLSHETIVVNTDSCDSELDKLLDWNATPMIAHYHGGKFVRSGIGLDGILAFEGENDNTTGPGNPAATAVEATREGVKAPEAKPPTGLSIEEILREAEHQAPPAPEARGSGVADEGQEDQEKPSQVQSVNTGADGVEKQ